MGVTATRYPRRKNLVRINNCLNPSNEVSQDGWSFLGDTTVCQNVRGNGYPRNGSLGLYRQYSGQPATWEDHGFQYYCNNWPAGATRAVRIQAAISIDSVQTCIKAFFYNASNQVIGSVQYGDVATSIAGQWGDVTAQFTAPAGTTYVRLNYVMLQQGRAPGAGTIFACDGLLIENDGVQRTPYFDGDTYAAGYNDYSTTWEGTPGLSRSLMYQLDPDDVVSPTLILGYDVSQPSRNIVHQLIDGGVAATVLPASTRRGVLRYFFATAAAADAARRGHAAQGVWTYTDTDQPQENMRYVVDGEARKVQDENRLRWTLEVPFREVS